MKLRHECDVDSLTRIESNVSFSLDDKIVTLYIDDHQNVNRISIEKELPQGEFKLPTFEKGADGVWNIVWDVHPEIERELQQDLVFLEQYLCLHNVKKIHHEKVAAELVPENEEERKLIQVHSMQLRTRKPKRPMELPRRALEDIERYRGLIGPLSFFREGCLAIENDKYITSYYNFYLVIEGFYSRGKHQNLEKIFATDAELVTLVDGLLRESKSELIEPFAQDVPAEQLPLTAEGFLKSMVRTRHRLHHYFHPRGDRYITPITDKECKGKALALMVLAARIIDTKAKAASLMASNHRLIRHK